MYEKIFSPGTAPKNLKPPILVDLTLLIVTVLLVSGSIVMVYSTTGVVSHEKYADSLYYVKRQGAAAIIGFILLCIVSRIRPIALKKISPLFYPAALGLLLLTLIPGLGTTAGGAQRWIDMGIARFQPAELVKVFFVLFLAGYFARHEKDTGKFSHGMLMPFVFLAPLAALLLKQPDFGSSVILAMVALAMATAAGVRLRHLILSFAVCGAAVIGLVATSPYRMNRILSFLSPMHDVQGRGYQLMQSLIAVGSGNLSGVGLGGSQQKLFFLPAAHTDFIYAVIAEELGFLGAAFIIVCFLTFLARGLVLAGRMAEDTFSFCLAVGMTLLIVGPALLNIGVVIGILPTKGLVLPLVGYGGSSLVASLVVVGLLLAVVRDFRAKRI